MVARLFVASLLPWDDYLKKSRTYHGTELSSLKNQPSLDNTILVTTDADLWPLSPNMYHFPRGTFRFFTWPRKIILISEILLNELFVISHLVLGSVSTNYSNSLIHAHAASPLCGKLKNFLKYLPSCSRYHMFEIIIIN